MNILAYDLDSLRRIVRKLYAENNKLKHKLGNLIALPLQGQALKYGNSAFVDENLNAYPDQWDILLHQTQRLSAADIQGYITKWHAELNEHTDVFEQDLVESEKKVIVSSPEIIESKVRRFIDLMKARQEAGVRVTVITLDPEQILYGSPDFCQSLINLMKDNGIDVVTKQNLPEHFAVIDDELVWHGGMNLLGKEDFWDNLMRIQSTAVATELLELTLT